MPFPILLSLLFYLGTLAATQTAYGGRFMTIRWVGLAALTGVSLLYWLMGRLPRRDPLDNHGTPSMVWVYLLATLASVATAQNQVFSGLRWVSHAMLLITFMLLLRGTFHSRTANQVIWIPKGITLLLLAVSFFMPAPPTVYETPYFRGAMGDSNSLGHVAMLCALFYFHGGVVSSKTQWKLLQFAIALVAAGILIFTWARSSMVGFLVGLMLLNHFYGLTRSLLAKSGALLLICFLLASPLIQSGILAFVAKDREAKEKELASQVLAVTKGNFYKQGPTFEKIIETRIFLWSESWEGFKKKPFLGWGFGANENAQSEWSIRPTSGGMVRDITNDSLFTLEGSGIIGFLAYIGLIISILKQSLTKQQVIRIRKNPKKRLPIGETPIENHSLARDHQQAIFYIISISLFALFQTDGSAFSAGSLISAIFWICASAAGALRAEAVATERRMNAIKQGVLTSAGSRIRLRNPKWEGGKV
jgi:O-antigen ligase